MAKDEQVSMPSSQGGLVQYFESDTGFEMDPKTVIGGIGLLVVLEMALHMGILI